MQNDFNNPYFENETKLPPPKKKKKKRRSKTQIISKKNKKVSNPMFSIPPIGSPKLFMHAFLLLNWYLFLIDIFIYNIL